MFKNTKNYINRLIEEIKKIKPTTKVEKDNEVNTDDKDEDIGVFDEITEEEKPLVLTQEVKDKPAEIKTKIDQTLSPAVRKIVTENKIDISSVKGESQPIIVHSKNKQDKDKSKTSAA